MSGKRTTITFLSVCFCLVVVCNAGPYNEIGINGYVGDDWQHADPIDADAVLNPIFRGWADGVASYEPAPGVGGDWDDPTKTLGPAEGDHQDIVSLGDLDQQQINQGVPPGSITLSFSEPNRIRDVNGYDFVVFENSFISGWTVPSLGCTTGEVFAELGYVEVSSNGADFVRFSGVSLTDGLVGLLGTVDITDIFNLAGKHPNGYGKCTGTPFDLAEIADDPNVVSGAVDINDIRYVRIIDVPGSGDFNDMALEHIDPNSCPVWACYDANHPIYDAWDALVTPDSGGFDLEAIGVLKGQNYSADINIDGTVDVYDLSAFISAWLSRFGENGWIARCDLAEPKDLVVNLSDFAVFAAQWLKTEQWRSE